METCTEQSGDNLDSKKNIWKKDVPEGVGWAVVLAFIAAEVGLLAEVVRSTRDEVKAVKEIQAADARLEELFGPLVTTRQKLLDASRMENTSLEKVPGATAEEK